MSYSKINILVGGPKEFWPNDLKNNQIKGKWIGVDRGNLRLLEHGITPQVAIGDFDSINQNELDAIKRNVRDIRQFDSAKDDTDTELGLKIAVGEYQADQFNIYGATGGRLDHFLSNLFLTLQPRFKKYAEKIQIIDRQNTLSFYLPGNHRVDKEADKKYLAFVPLSPMNLTLNNEKYTLDHYPVQHPFSFASNEFIHNYGDFNFDSGVMCVIQSKD